MSEKIVNPNRTYTEEDKTRLKKLFMDGITTFQEIEDLRQSLNDTVKAVGEEMGIKPGQLQKAIKIAHKANLGEEKDKLDEIEEILRAAGQNHI